MTYSQALVKTLLRNSATRKEDLFSLLGKGGLGRISRALRTPDGEIPLAPPLGKGEGSSTLSLVKEGWGGFHVRRGRQTAKSPSLPFRKGGKETSIFFCLRKHRENKTKKRRTCDAQRYSQEEMFEPHENRVDAQRHHQD